MTAYRNLPDAPLDSPEGAAAAFAGAEAQEAGAMHSAALLLAAGVQCDQHWDEALDWLTRSAEGGDRAAKAELVALSDDEELVEELTRMEALRQLAPASLWRRFGKGVDLGLLLAAPKGVRMMGADPRIGTVEHMASPRACLWLARHALPELHDVRVQVDGVEGLVAHPNRTNTAMSFRMANTGLPALALRERMADLMGVRIGQMEPTQVLRYEPGQAYHTHFDAFPDDAVGRAGMALSGQRISTVLVSLNTNYEGGQTEFPTLGTSYRGGVGQAIFWSNADAEGRRDERTRHAGRPPTAGTKWMVSQWVRARDFVE